MNRWPGLGRFLILRDGRTSRASRPGWEAWEGEDGRRGRREVYSLWESPVRMTCMWLYQTEVGWKPFQIRWLLLQNITGMVLCSLSLGIISKTFTTLYTVKRFNITILCIYMYITLFLSLWRGPQKTLSPPPPYKKNTYIDILLWLPWWDPLKWYSTRNASDSSRSMRVVDGGPRCEIQLYVYREWWIHLHGEDGGRGTVCRLRYAS